MYIVSKRRILLISNGSRSSHPIAYIFAYATPRECSPVLIQRDCTRTLLWIPSVQDDTTQQISFGTGVTTVEQRNRNDGLYENTRCL